MKKIFIFLLVLNISLLHSQENILVLNKVEESKFKLDGIISDDEILGASILELKYESEPGYNSEPSKRTTSFIVYSENFLYVGIRAYRDNIVSPIVPRDNGSLFSGDFSGINLDTYGDARNNIFLASNLYGSQFDAIRLEGTGYGGSPYNMNVNANFDFKSLGKETEYGYEMEFIIPFSELPFPNGTNQRWKIDIYTGYPDTSGQGVEVRAGTSMENRDSSCKLCLLDHTIVMNEINIQKKLNFLPYISSNISGNRELYNEEINFDSTNFNYGLGFNFELNKNLSIEGTINPDFSQVESDATRIDINSPTAINYPEKRPFFNKGIDIMDFSIDVFNSRSINNPSFAAKALNQGKKSRLYILSALDDETPYLVPTQFESFSGVGSKSFNNVIRYQRFINSNTQLGTVFMNRSYNGGGFGSVFGIDGLFKFSNNWKFEFEFFTNSNKEPIADWIDSNNLFGNYTAKLDGESFSGTGVFAEIRRETENWRSFFQYTSLSKGFRSDLGFIVENDLKEYTLWHSYYQFPNKELIKNYRVSLRHDLKYNQNHDISRSSFQTYLSFLTIFNTNVTYNYEYNFVKSHLAYQFKDFINHYVRMSTRPSDYIVINIFYKFGKDIAYRTEVPMLGYEKNLRLSMEISVNDNLRLRPSISYSDIKKLDDTGYYFKGYISRLDMRYQFSSILDFRIISEYNNFSNKIFVQPLISWKPNPDTIFYLGGNQNYINDFIDYNSKYYKANKTQLFLKLQYLIK